MFFAFEGYVRIPNFNYAVHSKRRRTSTPNHQHAEQIFRDFFYSLRMEVQASGSRDGKQPHIASAVDELEARPEEDYANVTATARTKTKAKTNSKSAHHWLAPITRKSTFLLDDESRSIRHTVLSTNGVRAIWFDPK